MTRTGLALLALLVPQTIIAQSDSPAVRRAREIVALINQGTPAAIRAYADSAFAGQMKQMPPAAHINFMMGQRNLAQGLDWVGTLKEGPGTATVHLKRRLTGEPLALVVNTEGDRAFVSGIGQAPPPPGPAVVVKSDEDMAAQLEEYVSKLAGADVFSGAVLLAHNGKVVFSKAYGIANKDFDAPNNIDTRFNLGSMNKMFTAVAVAQLVEQGKVSYDDPLSKYTDFPNPDAAKKIKIKHLLTHTSGLGSYFNEEFDRTSRARYKTVDQMLELAKGETLAFEPGTRWSYSNTGMLVLGKVIEEASGKDYFTYIRDHVYAPAGMTRSDSYELDYVNPNLAVGYEKEYLPNGEIRYRNNVFQHVIKGGPAGGGYSTVGDLLRFAEALKSGKLVSAATFELLTTPKPEIGSPSYGYGFSTGGGKGPVGHSGGFPGISSNLDIFKDSGWVAVVLSNYGGGSQPVTQKMRQLIAARARPTS